tara:strand:- start:58 stop:492 length:435 start_codon:yes stop_codon:yes gene_type:complete
MSDALKVNLQQVEDLIKGLDSNEKLELLNSLKNQPTDFDGRLEFGSQRDNIVDINQAESSILGSDPSRKIANTNLTLQDHYDLAGVGDANLRAKDNSVLRRLGTDEGLMGIYDKALQSRKNDRLLQGGGMVADMIQRMALINKL